MPSESTLAHKAANTPLLETGEMRDSIEKMIGFHVAHVGSNNDKAVWQELGTSRIPARSFIATAGMAREDEIHKLARRTVGRALGGHGVSEAEMLLHAVIEAGQVIIDTAKEFGKDDNNGK